MRKPNIRGVPKNTLRFRLGGWLDLSGARIFEHRWLLRSSWIHRIAKDISIQPIITRSGIVLVSRLHVARQSKTRFVKPKILIYAVTISGLLLGIELFDNHAPLTQSMVQDIAKGERETQGISCANFLQNPKHELELWVSKGVSNRVKIQEVAETVIGGVKSKSIKFSCGQQSNSFRLSLVKRDEKWLLNNFARLEN